MVPGRAWRQSRTFCRGAHHAVRMKQIALPPPSTRQQTQLASRPNWSQDPCHDAGRSRQVVLDQQRSRWSSSGDRRREARLERRPRSIASVGGRRARARHGVRATVWRALYPRAANGEEVSPWATTLSKIVRVTTATSRSPSLASRLSTRSAQARSRQAPAGRTSRRTQRSSDRGPTSRATSATGTIRTMVSARTAKTASVHRR